MDVGNVQSQEELQRLMQTSRTSESTGQKPPPPPDGKMPPPMGDSVSMSSLAEMVQSGELTEEDLEELHSFGKQIGDSFQNGTFSASSLAENAPEALKTLAESEGMTVEELIGEMADKMSAFLANAPASGQYGPPPGPPPEGFMGQEDSQEDSGETEESTDL